MPDYHYQSRTRFLGYPPYPVPAPPPGPVTAPAVLRQTFRLTSYAHAGNLTPEQADAVARNFRELEYNAILSEGNRYLFRDAGDPQAPTLMESPIFPDLIRSSKVMADACHRQGLAFYLHLTCTMAAPHLLEKHPDWAALDLVTGKPITNGYGTTNTCFNNPDFMHEFCTRLERLMRESGADGMMLDEVQFLSPTLCGCHWCRDGFTRATGFSVPGKLDGWLYQFTANPSYRDWLKWRRAKVVENLVKAREVCRRVKPDSLMLNYLCNNSVSWCYYASGLCVNDFLLYDDSVGYECEPPGYLYLYQTGLLIAELKHLRAAAERLGTAPWALFYDRLIGDQTWNWFVCMSQGARRWWALTDPASVPYAKPLLGWERRHENILAGVCSAANIGILFSLDSRDRNPAVVGGGKWVEGYVATCNLLTDRQIPYKVLLEEDLTAERLVGLRTLVLLNTGSMSAAAVAAVTQFVSAGGVLVASGNVSAFTENGEKRADFGLRDVLGCSFAGESAGGGRLTLAPAAAGLAADRGQVLTTSPDPYTRIMNLAPEVKVLGTLEVTGGATQPGLLTRSYGKGTVLYFAGHPELCYFAPAFYHGPTVLKPGTVWKDPRDRQAGDFLCRAICYANDTLPCEVRNLPPGVVVESYRHERGGLRGLQVHLANFLGGRLADGTVPVQYDINFPDVRAALPDPAQPITIRVLAPATRKVYGLSPDFDAVAELPFVRDGERIAVSFSTFHRYLILYFSEGDDAGILGLGNGKTVQGLPVAAKTLAVETIAPLVGAYDAAHTVVFSDTPAFTGGRDFGRYKNEYARIVYGKASGVDRATARVTLAAVPAQPVLDIGAMDDNPTDRKAPVEIRVNGQAVFAGASQWPDEEWAVLSFPLSADLLKAGANTVEIGNTGDGPQGSPPWLAVSFVRVRAGTKPGRP